MKIVTYYFLFYEQKFRYFFAKTHDLSLPRAERIQSESSRPVTSRYSEHYFSNECRLISSRC
jgi:hypothetical protein